MCLETPPCLAVSVCPAIRIRLQGSHDFVIGQGTTAGKLSLTWRKGGSETGPERLWAEGPVHRPDGGGAVLGGNVHQAPQHN